MTSQSKHKISKKIKITILILLALVILSASALAVHVIYRNRLAESNATVVVPDNLIGETPTGRSETSYAEQPSIQESDESFSLTVTENPSVNTDTPSADASSVPSASQSDIQSSTAHQTQIRQTAQAVQAASGNQSNTPSGTQTATTLALYKDNPSDNQSFDVQNMFPGDTQTKYFAVNLSHHADATVYFSTEITEQTQALAEILNIKVTVLNSNKLLYDGVFADMNANGYGETFAVTQSTETVIYYKIQVSVPTSAGNEYQDARLSADFNWAVQNTESLIDPDDGGDVSNILWIILMCSAAATLLVLIIIKRKERDVE